MKSIMMENDSLFEIAKALEEADTVLLLSHIIPDGDTIGSCVALSDALGKMGKTVHICPGEPLPANLTFLEDPSFFPQAGLLPRYDAVVAVDCSDRDRLGSRLPLLERGRLTINIDHHKTNTFYGMLNHVQGNRAAAGEIIFALFQAGGWKLSPKAAQGLYTAIVTDTGQFQYSNTTGDTHRIAAALIEAGIDRDRISINLYQSDSKTKLPVTYACLSHMAYYMEEQVALAFITHQELSSLGGTITDTDGMVEMLRNIEGVEISVFIKEIQPGLMKVGMRSKNWADVAEICTAFGGGGHTRAAGCSLHGNIDQVVEAILSRIEEYLDQRKGS